MNRLKICEKYMTGKTKERHPEKYWKAQNLHAKIIKKQDEKWRDLVLEEKACYNTKSQKIKD